MPSSGRASRPASSAVTPNVGWLFPDPTAAASDYYARTGIFPIMHIVGIRRALVDAHTWLPAAVLKAFEQAQAMAMARLGDTSATKVTMPFVEEQLKRIRDLMGHDYWSYGVAGNRKVLDTFLHHHHAQGLSSRRLSVDRRLFHPTTFGGHSSFSRRPGTARHCFHARSSARVRRATVLGARQWDNGRVTRAPACGEIDTAARSMTDILCRTA